MPTTQLAQIVTYVKPSLAKLILKDVKKDELSISKVVARILRQHYEKSTTI